LKARFRVSGPDGKAVFMDLKGREAWALEILVSAGAGGCTPIDHPGPRRSDYVVKLRGCGIDVATITEAHGGEFAGSHARYVLRTKVELVAP